MAKKRANECLNTEIRFGQRIYKLSNALVVLVVLFVAAVAVLAVFVADGAARSVRLENAYQKSAFEASENLNNIEIGLSKLMVSADGAYSAALAAEVSRQADNAATNLAQLPIEGNGLVESERLVNQIGDFCRVLNRKLARGAMSEADFNGVALLHKQAVEAAQGMEDFALRLNGTTLARDGFRKRFEARRGERGARDGGNAARGGGNAARGGGNAARGGGNAARSGSNAARGEGDIERGVQGAINNEINNLNNSGAANGAISEQNSVFELSCDYTLLYDGIYSDGVQEFRHLAPLPSISKDSAARVVAEIFKPMGFVDFVFLGEAGGELDTFEFSLTHSDGSIGYAQITKKGGLLLCFELECEASGALIDNEAASKRAEEFCERLGFLNMRVQNVGDFSSEAYIRLISFVGNVGVMKDSITLKIALDSGEVVGFWAKEYLKNNHKRAINAPVISKATARAALKKGLDAKDDGLFLIDSEGGEQLAYRFACTEGENEFYIYIDGKTANTLDIQRVVWTLDGKKTK